MGLHYTIEFPSVHQVADVRISEQPCVGAIPHFLRKGFIGQDDTQHVQLQKEDKKVLAKSKDEERGRAVNKDTFSSVSGLINEWSVRGLTSNVSPAIPETTFRLSSFPKNKSALPESTMNSS